MSGAGEREQRTVAAIDALNEDDPEQVVIDGEARPLQQTLGRLAAEWVDRLDPSATPIERIAARAHHLRRWEISRRDFPEGRAGYLRWRTAAKTRHAADLEAVLREQGWSDDDVARARRLIRKEGLGRDPQVQTHEDAVCLAFLAVQLDAASETMGRDKTVDVLRRTAKKMSPEAIGRVAELALTDHGRALLAEALGSPD